jgi:hypothetical protein
MMRDAMLTQVLDLLPPQKILAAVLAVSLTLTTRQLWGSARGYHAESGTELAA